MGTNAVGGMIVAGPTGFMKTHYRTFNMKGEDLAPGDEFGMMRAMLRRRFVRLAKEPPRNVAAPTLPLAGEVAGAKRVTEGSRASEARCVGAAADPSPPPLSPSGPPPRFGEGLGSPPLPPPAPPPKRTAPPHPRGFQSA